MTWRSRSRIAGSAVLAIAVAGVLLVGGVSVAGADLPPTLRFDAGPAAPPRTVGAASEVTHPGAQAPGATVKTLSLFNNTVRSGNFLPNYTYSPQDVAYDPTNGTVWFTAGDQVGVANASTGAGIAFRPSADGVGLVYDNRSNRVFVVNQGYESVSVFDAATYAQVGTVAVGLQPTGIAYDWQTDQVYVTQETNLPGYENATVIDATSLAVTTDIPVGSYPEAAVFVPTAHEVWVLNKFSENITVIDASTLTSSVSIPLYGSSYPAEAVFDSEDNTVYVANAGTYGGVEGFSVGSHTSISNITLGTDSQGLAVDPTIHTLYVADESQGLVYEVNTVGNVDEGAIGLGTYSDPDSAAYDPADHRVLVTCYDGDFYASSNVTEISTASNSTAVTVPMELLPIGAVYDGRTHSIYTYDGGAGVVDQINDTTDRVVRSVFVGYTPHTIGNGVGGLVLVNASGSLYVASDNTLISEVSLVNLTSFTVTAVLPSTWFDGPAGLAYDALDDRVYVANYYSSNVTIMNALTGALVGWAPVGSHPLGAVDDPDTDQIFVENTYEDFVTILDGATGALVAQPVTGLAPVEAAYDSYNQDVYVANGETASLTVIASSNDSDVMNISVPGGGYPQWVSYDPENHSLEVTSAAGGADEPGYLAVVSDLNQSFAGQIYVGTWPGGTVFDPEVNETFVPDYSPGSVSVVRLGAVSPPPPLEVASLVADPSTIYLGSGSDLVTTASGGSPPLTYAYSTLPPGCATTNLSTLPCEPSAVGVYTIGVNVTDTAAGHGSATTTLTVLAATTPLAVSLAAAPTSIPLGQATTLTATASGGTRPYSYVYGFLPPGCTSANNSSLSCTPSAAGTYHPVVNLTDNLGVEAQNSTALIVSTSVPSLGAVLTATPSTVALNGSTQFLTTVSGGVSPYGYVYSSLPPGCTTSNSSTLTCVPTASGTFHPMVTVTDHAGKTASANATLTVTGATQPSGTSSSSFPWWAWVAIALAILLVIFFFVARRRRKRGPAVAPGPTGPPASASEGPSSPPPPPG
jgi:YVTN family beta-propeller protein